MNLNFHKSIFFKYTLNYFLFIFIIIAIILGNTGFWFMPNINVQFIVSQNLFHNPFSDPDAHYIFTNYFQPLLFKLIGGNSIDQYLIYTFFVSILFLVVFLVWFLKYHFIDLKKEFYKIFPIITMSVFFVPLYWVGMDGMTLLLMLLILMNYNSKFGIIFSILLGIQHFEQGIVAFLLLSGSLVVFKLFNLNNNIAKPFTRFTIIIVSIMIGKLILLSWFYYLDIKILGNRLTYMENYLQAFVNQWLEGYHYILYSFFGIGWLVILKNVKQTYPLIIVSFIALFIVMMLGDQGRVGSIILFPSLFYWIIMNQSLIKKINIKFAFYSLILYLLLPVVYVWGGYPFGSLLKYDLKVYQNKIPIKDVNFLIPFKKSEQEIFNSIIYNGSILNSQIGNIENTSRVALADIDKPGYITFGPYINLKSGNYKFIISYISSESISTNIGTWDVGIALSKEFIQLKKGDLLGSKNQENNIIQTFTIPEKYSDREVEIRNYYNGIGNLTIKNLAIMKIE